MTIWSVGAIVYVVARTIGAGVLIVLAVRRRAPGALAAQGLSDAAVALLVLAYARYPLRAALGWVSVPLFVYFIAWEALAAAQRLDTMGVTMDGSLSDAELLGGTTRWVWDAWSIAPAFVTGALVVGSVFWPGGWALPGTPSALSCAPAAVVAGDTLTLRMRTPHGGDLGVFTPRLRYLTLRSAPAAGTVPEADRFEHQRRLVIPTASATGRRAHATVDEPVFADSGTYTFGMSEYLDPSVSFTCAVHYHP